MEQFRRKGYKCQEIKEQSSTLFIIRHEKNQSDVLALINGVYKNLLKTN